MDIAKELEWYRSHKNTMVYTWKSAVFGRGSASQAAANLKFTSETQG